MHQVLLIDDDAGLGEVLTEYCAQFSIRLDVSTTPSHGLSRLRTQPYDAVILDVMLPEMDGFDVLRELRKRWNTPVIMLSARGDVMDRIVGLEIGADDYVPKPFDPRELVARLISNIKRQDSTRTSPDTAASAMRCFEDITIDPEQRTVEVQQHAVTLTTKEYALLMLLSSEPGRAWSRDDILASLKGTDNELFSRSVDILVSRLRVKLKPVTPVVTIHGEGYAFIARRLPG